MGGRTTQRTCCSLSHWQLDANPFTETGVADLCKHGDAKGFFTRLYICSSAKIHLHLLRQANKFYASKAAVAKAAENLQ
ncbi:hypothetical protein Vi05172_g8924 [Venturia inaequalis]|nr:hypothetical protein Vi05172_g8924 [Venturia inaequalis]